MLIGFSATRARTQLSCSLSPCSFLVHSFRPLCKECLPPPFHTCRSRVGEIKLGMQNQTLVTPLESTLIEMPASVDSKPLTQSLSPLDATLTETRGEGVQLLLTRNPRQGSHPGWPSRAQALLPLRSAGTSHGSRS